LQEISPATLAAFLDNMKAEYDKLEKEAKQLVDAFELCRYIDE
jgi:hypothetical protein